MSEKKIVGQLDLDVKPLSKSLKEAQKDLDGFKQYLNKTSKELSGFVIDNGQMQTSINKAVEEVKFKVKDMVDEYLKASQKAKGISSDVAKSISDSWKSGFTSSKDALTATEKEIENLKKKRQEIIDQNKQLRSNYVEVNGTSKGFKELDATKVTSQIAKLTKLKADVEKSLSGAMKGDFKHDFEIGFKGDKKGYSEYLAEMLKSEELTAKDRLEVEKKLHDVKKQMDIESTQDRVSKEKEANEKIEEASKAVWKNIELYKEKVFSGDDTGFKKYLDGIINSGKLINKELDKATKLSVSLDNNIKKDTFVNAETISQKRGIPLEQALKELQGVSSKTQKQMVEDAKKFEAESKKIAKNLEHEFKVTYDGDKVAFKKYLDDKIENGKLAEDTLVKLRKKRADIEKQIDKEAVASQKKALEQQQREVEEFNRNLREKQSSKNSGNNLTGAVVGTAVAYQAMQGLKQGFDEVKTVEAEIAQLTRVMPELTDSAKKSMQDFAFQTAYSTGNSVQSIIEIQTAWSRISDEVANNPKLLNHLTNVTAQLMKVGEIDNADEAVAGLNASVQQLGLSYQNAEELANSWMKTADISAAGTAGDMMNVYKKVGQEAKEFGLNIYQFDSLIGGVANRMGISGSEIGDAFKTIFTYIKDEKSIDLLHKHGIEVMRNAEEYNHLFVVLDQLKKKEEEYRKSGNQKGINEIEGVLGKIRRKPAVKALIESMDGSAEMIKSVRQEWEKFQESGTSYADRQMLPLLDTIDVKLQNFKTAFSEFASSLGSTGITSAFKLLLDDVTGFTKWLGSLDSSTKRTVLSMAGLAGTIFTVNKALDVLKGTKAISMLANDMARLALMGGETSRLKQSMLDVSIAMGANVEKKVVDTATTTANTVANTANTASNQANSASKTQNTAQTATNTVSKESNAKATIAVTEAQMASTASTTGFGYALQSLFSPLNIVIATLGILAMKYYEVKMASAEAQRRQESFAQEQEKLNKRLSVKHISNEGEKTQYQAEYEELQKLMPLLDDYKAKKEKLESYKKAGFVYDPANHKNSNYNSKMAGADDKTRKEAEELAKEVDNLNKKFEEKGVTIETLLPSIDKYKNLLSGAKDSNSMLLNSIYDTVEAKKQQGAEVLSLIDRYEVLHAQVVENGVVSQEYKDIVSSLSAGFSQYIVSVNDATGVTEFNVDAIRKATGATEVLTEAQYKEIFAIQNLTESHKQALAVKIDNEMTHTRQTIAETQKRLDAYQAEADGLLTLWQISGKFDGSGTLGNDGDLLALNMYIGEATAQIDELKNKLQNSSNMLGALKSYKPSSGGGYDKPAYTPSPERSHNSGGGRSNAEMEAERAKREAEEAKRKAEEALREAERLMKEREGRILSLQSKITSGLKKMYEEEKDARIKTLKAEEEAQIKVSQGKIKELEEKIKALRDTEEDEKKDLEGLRKSLNSWKKDDSDYGKQKVRELEKTIKQKEKELQIKDYEKQIEEVKSDEDKVKKYYEDRLDAQSEFYDTELKRLDDMLKEKNLYEQASTLITSQNQDEILRILTTYVPEYGNLGTLFGKSLMESMQAEVKQGMDDIWQLLTREIPGTAPSGGGSSSSSGGSSQSSSGGGNISWDGNEYGWGSESETVRRIQKNLNSLGYGLAEDGKFYQGTTKAVRDFQGNNGLKVDGWVGRDTWAKLMKFDTGGYTGDWSGGSGKLAMLHSKERVLTAQQTKAFEYLAYNVLPNIKVSTPDLSRLKNNVTNNNYNAPLVKNDINIVNNTPFEAKNSMDNLERAIKTELKNIGYNKGV